METIESLKETIKQLNAQKLGIQDKISEAEAKLQELFNKEVVGKFFKRTTRDNNQEYIAVTHIDENGHIRGTVYTFFYLVEKSFFTISSPSSVRREVGAMISSELLLKTSEEISKDEFLEKILKY